MGMFIWNFFLIEHPSCSGLFLWLTNANFEDESNSCKFNGKRKPIYRKTLAKMF